MNTFHPHCTDDLNIAVQAAQAAAAIIKAKWNTQLVVRKKGSVDLVTEVDQAAEAAILSILGGAFPKDEIIAEETGTHLGSSGRMWYVDPLDGTTNFSHGMPHFCISIGLFTEAKPLVGVICDPLRDWYFTAIAGHGAFLNGQRLAVSETLALEDALLATGFPYDRWTNRDNNSHRLSHMLRLCQGVRRPGAAALDLAYVAAGWLDGYWEDRLNPWDVSAGLLLVTEAGGVVTDYGGSPASPRSDSFIAANTSIHGPLMRALTDAQLTDQQES